MSVHRAILAGGAILAALATQACLPGTIVYPAQLIIPQGALAVQGAEPPCFLGANAEGSLSSFVRSTYPEEEWKDQYRSRLLGSLSPLLPGETFRGSVGFSRPSGFIRFSRSTHHPLSFVDTCLSSTGSYRCSLPTSHGARHSVACEFSPFPGWEGSEGGSPRQIEISYFVEACRSSPCAGGWRITVERIRPEASP